MSSMYIWRVRTEIPAECDSQPAKMKGQQLLITLLAMSSLWSSLYSFQILAQGTADATALLELKSSVGDPLGALRNWEPARAVCTWSGVGCGNRSRVVSLDLPFKNLNGSIPPSLFSALPFLSYVNLSSNQLGGRIPDEVGNATRLKLLDLASNLLTGFMPATLGNLRDLEILRLSQNDLSGPIPAELGKCDRLVELQIGGASTGGNNANGINGTLPASLANCSALQVLNVTATQVTGAIPPELLTPRAITVLVLRMNNLKGRLDPGLGNLTSLRVLDLSYNDLDGSIPSELGSLENLVELRLGAKSFTFAFPNGQPINEKSRIAGYIPPALGRLQSLQVLDLSDTGLHGSIPVSIANLTSLQVLLLRNNNLTGDIPPGLPTSLTMLDLSQNKLHGLIPAQLGNLSHLVSLDLSFNDLFGPLPSEVALCRQLQGLVFGGAADQVSKADITGSLPEGLGLLPLQYIAIYAGRMDGNLRPLINCTAMWSVLVTENEVRGPIPPEFANFTHLVYLAVAGNALEGSLSEVGWEAFRALRYLDLQRNNFTGLIPESMSQLENMQGINLSKNNFYGSIPLSMRNLSQLEWLVISDNAFDGDVSTFFDSVHPEDGQSSNIKALVGSRNRFTGQLPQSLTVFTNLQILVLSGNSLEGVIPSSIVDLPSFRMENVSVDNILRGEYAVINLDINSGPRNYYSFSLAVTVLDLSHNMFVGTIPENIGEMLGLHFLNLSSNHLSGSIPSSLGDITNIIELDLSFNNLSDNIPQELGKLTKLATFNLSYNNLTGPIPSGSQISTFPNAFLGNTRLCGVPLPEDCSFTSSQSNTSGIEVKASNQEFISYEALGIGFTVAFIACLYYFIYTKHGWNYIKPKEGTYLRTYGAFQEKD